MGAGSRSWAGLFRSGGVALVGVSVLALGACSGDDPEPRFAPPSTSTSAPSSPSTSAVSGPVAPTMPAQARGSDAAAAEAFVRFYWDMADYAQATGDVEGLRALGTSACKACAAGIEGIQDVYQRGGRLQGGGTEVAILESTRLRAGDHVGISVTARVTNARQVLDFPGHSKDQVFPAGNVTAEFIVDPTDNGWALAYWADKA